MHGQGMFFVGRTKNLGTCRACFYAGHAPLCPAYNKGATSGSCPAFYILPVKAIMRRLITVGALLHIMALMEPHE